MEQAQSVDRSPAEVAEKIADSHARAVVFPKMEFEDKAPVGEIAQRMVGPANAKTTGLYDRRNDDIGLDEVERIVI